MACESTRLALSKHPQSDWCCSLVRYVKSSGGYRSSLQDVIGDGLRADKAFQSFPDPSPSNDSLDTAHEPRPLAPFLRSRVLEHGTFGVSHTRVPTESRPGHVALIAGLYEDVSAVMTGWKLNPVNFDSVFNRSRHTWSWGSPDILPMFEQGAVPGRVYADTYGAEFEDFSKDAVELDIWVFDRVKQLFEDAKTNTTLDAELRKEKNVFFLHLLGLDTTGHSWRPYSKQYLNNIKVVDQGVQEITKLVDDFYDDGKTAYVFTADHGMSDWGSHGDGHPDNTRTPLIVWGSGAAKPVVSTVGVANGHEDGFSSDWGLDHIQRHDVAQADIAALMAYLVGLAFPTNSVGELPLSYLDTDPKSKAEALLVNAKQILEMYHVKEEQKKSTELRYKPFAGLGDESHSVGHRVAEIQMLIDQGKAEEAIRQSNELIQIGLQGLRYLQTYDWLFLRTLVTAGYIGWIVYAITTVIDLHVLNEQTETLRTVPSMVVFSSVLVALYSVLFMQSSPWIYYAYAFFPVMFWEEVWASRPALIKGYKVLFAHVSSPAQVVKLVLSVIGFFGLLEALVCLLLSLCGSFTDQNAGAKLLSTRDLHHLLCSCNVMAGVLRKGVYTAESSHYGDMGRVLPYDERFYHVARKQDGRPQPDVSLTTY
jgi:phosphatidylinositol glycan class N